MANTTSTRKCGNCGSAVEAGAVICPACDVLLAAYESPTGSSVGSSAATSPVDMTETPEPAPPVARPDIPDPPTTTPAPPPATSPTSDTLSALQERGTTRPSFELPRQSPIAKAMEETKAAVDATPQPTSDAEREAIASIMASADEIVKERQDALNVPRDYRDETDLEELELDFEPGDDHDEPDPPAAPRAPAQQRTAPPKPAPETKKKPPPSQSSVVNKVRAQAKAGWYDANNDHPTPSTASRERPAPSQRAANRRPPFQHSVIPEDSPNSLQNKAKIGAWIFGGLVVLGLLTRAGSAIGLLVPFIVIMLIWYMTSMARSTGRKTTAIPKDRRPR